jgi:hypothetical protein
MSTRIASVMSSLLVLSSLASLGPQASEALVDGTLSFSEQTTLLGDHNAYRSQTALGSTPSQPGASNMNQLFWDNGLAAVAQGWANQCIFAHNANRAAELDPQLARFHFDPDQVKVGESLFASTAAASLATLQNGIATWYEEHTDYTYSSQACSGVCGHYTQLVWAKTRYVGCGWKLCASLANTSATNASYFVCNYQISGNFVDQDPYAAGTACAQCDADRLTCSEGQCDGCASPNWDFCRDHFTNCDSLAPYCPSDCDPSSTDELCTGCRTTCGTCSAEMLAPEAACVDVPIPCSEGCDSFDECLDGSTLRDLTCDTATGFCVVSTVSCKSDSCLDAACPIAVPALGVHASVTMAWALATGALLGLSHRRWRG